MWIHQEGKLKQPSFQDLATETQSWCELNQLLVLNHPSIHVYHRLLPHFLPTIIFVVTGYLH